MVDEGVWPQKWYSASVTPGVLQCPAASEFSIQWNFSARDTDILSSVERCFFFFFRGWSRRVFCCLLQMSSFRNSIVTVTASHNMTFLPATDWNCIGSAEESFFIESFAVLDYVLIFCFCLLSRNLKDSLKSTITKWCVPNTALECCLFSFSLDFLLVRTIVKLALKSRQGLITTPNKKD